MPPRPPLANTFRIELLYTETHEIPPREAANIFYGQFIPPRNPTAADLVDAANTIKGRWMFRLGYAIQSDASLAQVVLTMIDGTELQETDTSLAIAGTGTGPQLLANAAMCISWHISRAYRGGHPRTYLPFPDGGQLDTGAGGGLNLWDPAAATAAALAATGFLDDMTGGTFGVQGPLAVGTVSYRTANAPRAVPVFFPYQDPARVNQRVATQRRRLGKLGTYH